MEEKVFVSGYETLSSSGVIGTILCRRFAYQCVLPYTGDALRRTYSFVVRLRRHHIEGMVDLAGFRMISRLFFNICEDSSGMKAASMRSMKACDQAAPLYGSSLPS